MHRQALRGAIVTAATAALTGCGGGDGGGPMGPPDDLVGTWTATHTLLLQGLPFAVCSGPFLVSSATGSTFSGMFSITGTEECIETGPISFSGTISGSQITITVAGDVIDELLEVCAITAGDAAFSGSAGGTSLMVARQNTITCTDPDDGSTLTGTIRWEIAAQKTG